jgi:diguanylate cyclase (GGDEF)-like protein
MTASASLAAVGPPTLERRRAPVRPELERHERRLAVVLVSPSNRREAVTAVRETRLEVEIAASSQEALLGIVRRRPSVVVVEEKCLSCDVATFVNSVRELPECAEVPVLLVGVSAAQARIASAAGITDVVRRPVNWEIAACRALRVAENYSARAELARAALDLDNLRQLHRQTGDRVQRLETVDALTGLPNREMFERIVEQSIPAAHRRGLRVALLNIDIDRFSEINQTLGRRIGDRVLQVVGQRLAQCLRETSHLRHQRASLSSATLGRLAADEFGVLVGGVTGADDAERLAHELLAAVADVAVVKDREVFVTASLGIALSAAEIDDRDALLQAAEVVTAEARREGGGRVKIYSPDLVLTTAHKRTMMSALRNALDRNALFLRYQPIVDIASGQIVAAEALLRWHDPVMGVISPGEFVPVAEETGLILPIGSWVLHTACLQLRKWLDAGLPKIRMAVNVALRQLEHGDLDQVVQHALEASGIEPSMLELEISERGGLPSDPTTLRQLHKLRDLGVRLAVDDFGTGESAIAYLRRLPINVIKIDRSYVAGFDTNNDNTVIASAMIAMAHGLNLEVVAEGVEVKSQLDLLETWGCDEFQGFLYSKAVGVEDFARLLSSDQTKGQERG